MIEIYEIEEKKVWDLFIADHTRDIVPFFQLWNWGEVQKKRGFEVLRIGFLDSKNLIGVCTIIVIHARRGNYFHLRHGPILVDFEKYFDICIQEIKKIAQEKKVSFLRVSPFFPIAEISEDFFVKRGYISSPIHKMDAEICWVLDTTKSLEDILKEMRKSHRYLVRKAQTMRISIIKSTKTTDNTQFLELYNDLAQRKHFIPHAGIQEEFDVFVRDNQASLFLARYDNKIIAGALVIFLEKMAIYHHAASRAAYRTIPASYLLQWEIIQEVKKRKIPLYNFWGVVSESDSKRHPWQGLSLFKKGFGGERREFIHAHDLPLSIWYWKTYLIESISKIRKGY